MSTFKTHCPHVNVYMCLTLTEAFRGPNTHFHAFSSALNSLQNFALEKRQLLESCKRQFIRPVAEHLEQQKLTV